MKRSRKYTAAGPREYKPDLAPHAEMKTRWFPDTLPEKEADYPKYIIFVENPDGSFRSSK